MLRLRVLFFVFILFILTDCTSKEKVTIRISGSTTVLPVVSRAAEVYRLDHPNVIITVNAGGSGVGINQVGEKAVDIGMASRDITAEEIKRFSATDFVTHVIGRDAVAVAVSSEVYNAGVKALSLREIRSIYDGEIKNWKDVGGFDKDILVIDKERSRGTRHVFMEAVFGDKYAEARGADLVLGSNNEEQTAIIQSDSAIGMLSFAWLNDDVKGAAIRDGKRVIKATKENIINGSYPISRALFLITDGEPVGAVKTFIDFIKSRRGQEIVEASGYVAIK